MNRLREFRCSRQISQQKLAEAIGVSRQTINAIERGRTKRPSDEIMLAIADYFEVPVEQIFYTPLVQHVLQKEKDLNIKSA
ncbi:helix-turn-helix transcriptional regulator [Desulfofundulus thermosubterraneus]|uniref:Putative transcriptional regulator n=1 Tax=Desulfofundulus thermosubterraneus DSM 16057 TaxID=1121432 RepID=A0A1M6F0Y3_9FIRM|nr:helix-turn-helix transcriptional regulator [Desulfofundulus thermosubterraneus]SHI91316.1 putative transcriptional regulator [Desulfofundulus thermosubterraneus DSM 16057]